MSQSDSTSLEVGQIIPAFSLSGPDGMPHSPWDYKQREHLVLLFLRSSTTNESRGLLLEFAQHYRAFREEGCAILAVTPDTVITNLRMQEALYLPFALLADVEGSVISRYTRWNEVTRSYLPSIVLADRYNAMYAQWTADNESELPSIEELLESLRYLNKLCTP
ncbi:MAG TPA: redoxin domain-containing protein [Ktedonobacteraceae bacterium]|nr:redoxin domain-containing protein [Ktedonobacteraceae bacterium]